MSYQSFSLDQLSSIQRNGFRRNVVHPSLQTLKSYLPFIKSCFNPISKHKLIHHLVLIQKVYTIQNCSFNETSVPKNPFFSAVQANLYLKIYLILPKYGRSLRVKVFKTGHKIQLQSTLVISTSVISNNRLTRRETLILVLT